MLSPAMQLSGLTQLILSDLNAPVSVRCVWMQVLLPAASCSVPWGSCSEAFRYTSGDRCCPPRCSGPGISRNSRRTGTLHPC